MILYWCISFYTLINWYILTVSPPIYMTILSWPYFTIRCLHCLSWSLCWRFFCFYIILCNCHWILIFSFEKLYVDTLDWGDSYYCFTHCEKLFEEALLITEDHHRCGCLISCGHVWLWSLSSFFAKMFVHLSLYTWYTEGKSSFWYD